MWLLKFYCRDMLLSSSLSCEQRRERALSRWWVVRMLCRETKGAVLYSTAQLQCFFCIRLPRQRNSWQSGKENEIKSKEKMGNHKSGEEIDAL